MPPFDSSELGLCLGSQRRRTPSIERRETRCRPPILRKPDLGLTICLVDPSESSRERVERRHHPLTRESTYNRQMTRLATGIELWRAAGHWRRHVEAALKPMGLSYNQFLIMHYIDVLLRQTEDAATQIEVATYSGIDRSTTSAAMRALDHVGLIDRGPSMSGTAYRVILSDSGESMLRTCERNLERTSDAFFSRVDDRRLLKLLRQLHAEDRTETTK